MARGGSRKRRRGRNADIACNTRLPQRRWKREMIQRERKKMKLNKEEKPSKTNLKEEERGRGKRVKKMEDTKVELDRVVEATEVAEEEEDHAKPIDEEDHVLLVPEADQKPYVAIIKKVYETEQMRLFKLTEKSLDVTRDDEARSRSGQPPAETPGSCANNASEYFTILSNFKVLTGERQRDKWLEKLLQSIQYFCCPVDNAQNDGTENGGSDAADLTGDTDSAKHVNESLDNSADGDVFRWPDSVVPAVVSLEKAAHEALSSDFQKYNQKMRQLTFNLKNTSLLARRLLKGELDPSQILNMSPKELKEALTEEELASREPEEPELIQMTNTCYTNLTQVKYIVSCCLNSDRFVAQMTDARCKRCTEKKVQLVEIIQAGHRDRYSLECVACGNTWYASRDEVASLTIGPNLAESVGAEPLATAKFEDVEKNLTSPRRADEGASDILKKTTEAYMPVLDSQKSFNKTKPEDSATTSNAD
ncbi:hypothetical protein CQW23_00105 [Capsicum baccatum]|uniref:TFIIS central domain-containing protein n=1 Tax=Capsicum baccatum TaxID=33114 RepID=A0A2G2XJR3_CAPBA|nr:hypothetical protein CQW23_00105 [Capsicum baccatum]